MINQIGSLKELTFQWVRQGEDILYSEKELGGSSGRMLVPMMLPSLAVLHRKAWWGGRAGIIKLANLICLFCFSKVATKHHMVVFRVKAT